MVKSILEGAEMAVVWKIQSMLGSAKTPPPVSPKSPP